MTLFSQGYDAMTIFSIAHPPECAELRLEAQAAADGLLLAVDAPGAAIALSSTEIAVLGDWLNAWLIAQPPTLPVLASAPSPAF